MGDSLRPESREASTNASSAWLSVWLAVGLLGLCFGAVGGYQVWSAANLKSDDWRTALLASARDLVQARVATVRQIVRTNANELTDSLPSKSDIDKKDFAKVFFEAAARRYSGQLDAFPEIPYMVLAGESPLFSATIGNLKCIKYLNWRTSSLYQNINYENRAGSSASALANQLPVSCDDPAQPGWYLAAQNTSLPLEPGQGFELSWSLAHSLTFRGKPISVVDISMPINPPGADPSLSRTATEPRYPLVFTVGLRVDDLGEWFGSILNENPGRRIFDRHRMLLVDPKGVVLAVSSPNSVMPQESNIPGIYADVYPDPLIVAAYKQSESTMKVAGGVSRGDLLFEEKNYVVQKKRIAIDPLLDWTLYLVTPDDEEANASLMALLGLSVAFLSGSLAIRSLRRRPIPNPKPAQPEAKSADEPSSEFTSKRLHRVLVVDDDPLIRQDSVRTLLGTNKFHVIDVGSCEAALLAWGVSEFDLVLMDMEMPGKDGCATTVELRRRQLGRPQVPILCLTSHTGGAVRDRALKAGMNGVLTKPLDIKAMVAEWRAAKQAMPSG